MLDSRDRGRDSDGNEVKRMVRKRTQATTRAACRRLRSSSRESLSSRSRKEQQSLGGNGRQKKIRSVGEEARERDDDDDLGRSRERERSLVHDTGQQESKPLRNDRESWIWNRRRGVEVREGHQSMKKKKNLLANKVVARVKGRKNLRGERNPGETKSKIVSW